MPVYYELTGWSSSGLEITKRFFSRGQALADASRINKSGGVADVFGPYEQPEPHGARRQLATETYFDTQARQDRARQGR